MSYCSVCDAPPGGCDHNVGRYLGPIQYEAVTDEAGHRIGWRVKDNDRARWDATHDRGPAPSRPVPAEEAQAPGLVEQHAYVLAITGQLGIGSFIQQEMLEDPDRAAAVLGHALRAPGIKNRAGFATANWNGGFDPRSSPRPVQKLLGEPGPPTLSALEYQWSKGPSALGELLLGTMAIAIAQAGGFKELQKTFREIEHYDDNGELLERFTV